MLVYLQVKDWVKERLEKFTPLSSQPQNVKDDLEKLQRQVTLIYTLIFPLTKHPTPQKSKSLNSPLKWHKPGKMSSKSSANISSITIH